MKLLQRAPLTCLTTSVDGILNINKPSGMTSFALVATVKRLSGVRRVGHAGTLDPEAIGVLPICLGQATRVIPFLQAATKTYRAEIELGVTTDTYDVWGQVTGRGDPSEITREQLESALASFTGVIPQTPPMYSAVRHQGRRLYELARLGITVPRQKRLAKIYHLELIAFKPPMVTIEVVCGKGTYVRSLAHDLGQVLGCGASLASLIRLRYGPFDIRDAASLPQLEEAFHQGCWQHLIHPVDSVLWDWQAIVVGDDTEDDLKHGRPLAGKNLNQPIPSVENYCRAYTHDGRFLGVLRFDKEKGQWQPERVFL